MGNVGKVKPALVFDFDGTMIKLFSNFNLKNTASQLKECVKKYGVDFDASSDAFDIFKAIASALPDGDMRKSAYKEANVILTLAELEAVKSGLPVKGVSEIFMGLYEKGYNLGIATNNSVECVLKFLSEYCLGIKVPVVGRFGDKPELMKPNTWSLVTVMRQMGCDGKNTIFIGDTSRDYECAVKVGCEFIGMAHSEYKRERLMKLIAQDSIVDDYYQLKNKSLC